MEISRHDALSDASGAPAEAALPLLDLRARREALRAEINNLPDTDEGDDAGNALVWRLCEAEVQIIEADARTQVDALVQVEQLCLWEQDGVVVGGKEAIERLLRVLPAQIERLAGEARS